MQANAATGKLLHCGFDAKASGMNICNKIFLYFNNDVYV